MADLVEEPQGRLRWLTEEEARACWLPVLDDSIGHTDAYDTVASHFFRASLYGGVVAATISAGISERHRLRPTRGPFFRDNSGCRCTRAPLSYQEIPAISRIYGIMLSPTVVAKGPPH